MENISQQKLLGELEDQKAALNFLAPIEPR